MIKVKNVMPGKKGIFKLVSPFEVRFFRNDTTIFSINRFQVYKTPDITKQSLKGRSLP